MGVSEIWSLEGTVRGNGGKELSDCNTHPRELKKQQNLQSFGNLKALLKNAVIHPFLTF